MKVAFRNMIGAVCVSLALSWGGSAQAQRGDADGLPYNEIEVTPDGVAFVAGGIGIKEQERLNAVAGKFNLKLVFTLHEGNYIADVNVVVKDENGRTVLTERADGPFLMAKLPAGRYTVEATYQGKTVTRTMSVRENGLRTAYLRWPSNPKTDGIVGLLEG